MTESDSHHPFADGIASDRPVQVGTLGRFGVCVAARPLEFARKVPKRPLSVLKAIIALGSPGVCEHRLADALWPDSEGDAARQALNMALHRLRRLLGRPRAVVVRDGRVGLDPRLCRVDVWEFERLTASLEDRSATADDAAHSLRRIFALYRGEFLYGDEDPWLIPARERLREKFVRGVATQAECLGQAGRWHEKLNFLRRAIDVDERAEAFYQGIMRATLHLDRKAEGLAVYRRLARTFQVQQCAAPNTDSERLRRSLLA